MKKLFILLISLINISLSAQQSVDNFRKNQLLQYANLSIRVKDLKTGKDVANYNSHNSVIPASTMKTVTTASALELLGSNFQFKTTLEIDGEISKNGTLKGNLYIRGGGDPTLGSEKLGDKDFLQKWVDAIKKTGIKSINGKIIACESHFETQVINPRWTWEDIGNYYAPGIFSISYLDNTLKVYFNSGSIGSTPQITKTEPTINNFKFNNYLISSNTKSDNAYFYGAPFINSREIYGEIPANKTDFISKADIPHPAELLLNDFNKALNNNGIITTGEFDFTQNGNCSKYVIYTHLSPELKEIIAEINHQSNNHFAEYTFKQLSVSNGKTGNTDAAINVINNLWKQKNLSTNELFQYDGCGLSPTDAVSANFFVELLDYMYSKSKNKEAFYNSLPVSGQSGTLKNFLNNTRLDGKVHAKSGTISRVKSYCGYIETGNRTLAFAVIVNNANGTSKEVTAKIENFLLEVSK